MDPFRAPVDQWTPLSPRALPLKRLMICLTWPIFFALASVPLFVWVKPWTGIALLVAGVAWTVYRWWRAARAIQAFGYAERETDLYIRKGLMFRSLTVVPYGRMQVVTVNSGPLERRFGLATVTLQTASSMTDATIPGLAAADADALRERLSTLGEQHLMGL